MTSLSVLVTRPRPQGVALCRALRARGARARFLPTLETVAAAPSAELESALHAATGCDWAIFVSGNAVRFGLAALAQRGWQLQEGVRTGAVGNGTASVMRSHGIRADCVPDQGFNSEALLALPEFDPRPGERVAIFRGDGGRGLLAQQLRERGAEVTFVEVYRRRIPALRPERVLATWQRGNANRWVVATSEAGLSNLFTVANNAAEAIRDAGLITVSARLGEAARARGWRGPIEVAVAPDNDGLLAAIGHAAQQP